MRVVECLILSLALVAALPLLSPPGAVHAQEKKSASAGLSGGYVISPQGDAGAGDPVWNHYGSAQVGMEAPGGPSPVNFCIDVYVTGIGAPTAAHLHVGRPGQNGPIVLELTPMAPGDAGSYFSHTCATVTDSNAFYIYLEPINGYIDIHNSDYPNGALRGQLQ